MTRWFLTFAMAAAGVVSGQDADGLVVTSPTWGVSVRRPSEEWSLASAGSRDDIIALKLADANGAVAATLELRWQLDAQTAAELRAKALRRYREAPTVKSAVELSGALGAEDAPGVEIELQSGGIEYRLRRIYSVHEGLEVALQYHAPVASFEKHEDDFAKICRSLAFVPLSKEAALKRLVTGLSRRCAADLGWATTWAEAARRAREEGKRVLALVRATGGFEIGGLLMSEVFMDRDIAALVRSRFVPIRYRVGMGAPFESAEVYGLSRSTFGSTILVSSPDGRVVAETSLLGRPWVDSFLRRAAKGTGPGPEAIESPADRTRRARSLLDGGDTAGALTCLGDDDGPDAHLLRARIHLRRRAVVSCRSALGAAASAGAERVAVELEWCRLMLRTGRPDAARRRLEAFLKAAPDTSDPELLFWLGRARYEDEDHAAAKQSWAAALAEKSSPFAWRSACWLAHAGFSTGITVLSTWPSPRVEKTLAPARPEPRPAGAVEDVRRQAIEMLLACQRTNGSWVSVEDYKPSTLVLPGQLTQAADALAILALWPHRDRPEVRAAVERGLARCLEVEALGRAHRSPVVFMDYSVWRDPSWIWALTRVLRDEPERADALRPVVEAAIEHLLETQKPSGGFGYYVTRKIGAEGSTQAMSFVTAYVLFALAEAREAGIDVPRPLQRGALKFLSGLRHENDTFEYMSTGGRSAEPPIPGAAGRGPLCALALHRFERASARDLDATLRVFTEHSVALARERHKGLMHTGAHTQGSHYLLFDYMTAALAASHLDADARAPYDRDVVERVLETRLRDGAFLDNPIVGRAAGTAMGLLALDLSSPAP